MKNLCECDKCGLVASVLNEAMRPALPENWSEVTFTTPHRGLEVVIQLCKDCSFGFHGWIKDHLTNVNKQLEKWRFTAGQ